MNKFCILFFTEVEGGQDWDIAAWADTLKEAIKIYNSIPAPKAIFKCLDGYLINVL